MPKTSNKLNIDFYVIYIISVMISPSLCFSFTYANMTMAVKALMHKSNYKKLQNLDVELIERSHICK